MESTSTIPFFQRTWVKYGIIAGIIPSLLCAVYYVISEDLLFNQYIGWVNILIAFGFGIAAALVKKKKQGGLITFADAMGTSIGAFMVALIIITLFSILLYYVIDPSLVDAATNARIKAMEENGPGRFMSQEQLDASIDMMAKHGHQYFIFGMLTMPFLFGAMGLLLYLISSAIIRKEPKI